MQNATVVTSAPPSSRRRLMGLTIGSVLLVGLMAVFAYGLQTRESTQLSGAKAPLFVMPTFEGGEIALEDLRGEVVVVNFWASWCVECFKEAALLEQAYQDYRHKGVMFLGVDYLDTEKEALAYMERYGITYPSGPDLGSKISDDYQITGVPETFFIDQGGNIVHVQIGPIERLQLYGLLERLTAADNS